jgi:hypothetical protein
MNDVVLNWQDLLIILAAFAFFGALAGLLIRRRSCKEQRVADDSTLENSRIQELEKPVRLGPLADS